MQLSLNWYMEIIHDSMYLFGLTERKYYFRVFSVCIHEWFKKHLFEFRWFSTKKTK